MGSSQKFIARNRAPRVQIEYDVELYGAEKKVQLPFVMGVMADLAGKPEEPLPPVADRKFLEFDVDNFDTRMKAMKPRVAFMVPNTLTGEGNLAVDLTFENMDDFSPAAVAAKVDGLKQLLEARGQLANLVTYMDGKAGAEELISKVLKDSALLLWKGHCSVHQRFRPAHIEAFRAEHPGGIVVVHPECAHDVVEAADQVGSTDYIIKAIAQAPAGSVIGVGTEIHLVNRLDAETPDKTVVSLDPLVCPCSTMFRIDAPHLAWILEGLVEGEVRNRITVDPETATWAKVALERMLATI